MISKSALSKVVFVRQSSLQAAKALPLTFDVASGYISSSLVQTRSALAEEAKRSEGGKSYMDRHAESVTE